MKKMKNVLRILVFTVLLCSLLGFSGRFLGQKDSVIALRPFLDHAQDYDVLFFGDSLVYNGIFPMEMYHRYGIAAYNLGSSNALLPMSYWRMVNALDYASPDVVLVSAVDAEKTSLVPDAGEWLHLLLDAFPMSLNKVRAILELTDVDGTDQNGVPFSEIRSGLLFPLQKYHSRWSDLTKEDYAPVYNTQKGAVPRLQVSRPGLALRPQDAGDSMPEEGYGYVYLRRVIEECRKRNISLVLYYPPGPMKPQRYAGLQTTERIAREYGVPFLNFVEMDNVIDEYTDLADTSGHLNCSGTKKVTDYLGRYITDHYDLPDRRKDPAYAHWNEEWDAYADEKIRMIAEDADSLRSRLMLLHDEDFSVVLTVRPGFDYDAENTKIALQNIAREHVYEEDMLTSAEIKPLEGLGDAADFNKGYMLIVDRDAGTDYERVQEFYGIGEQEFETSFGYVFCRMDGEWIDLSITQDGTETYYFDNWDDQDQDMRLILIDRRTGKPVLDMAFSR